MEMKTVAEMIQIVYNKKDRWCDNGVRKALFKLSKLPSSMTIKEIASLPDVIVSEWAYYWAKDIGDKEIVRDKVTESEWAYFWAKNVGDEEIMRGRITESEWAYRWARHVRDKEIMRDKGTDPGWINEWNKNFRRRKR